MQICLAIHMFLSRAFSCLYFSFNLSFYTLWTVFFFFIFLLYSSISFYTMYISVCSLWFLFHYCTSDMLFKLFFSLITNLIHFVSFPTYLRIYLYPLPCVKLFTLLSFVCNYSLNWFPLLLYPFFPPRGFCSRPFSPSLRRHCCSSGVTWLCVSCVQARLSCTSVTRGRRTAASWTESSTSALSRRSVEVAETMSLKRTVAWDGLLAISIMSRMSKKFVTTI